ncbi:MAG: hypothetical protein ACI4QC_10035 [Thermoguttaceae bacterium]
MNLLQQCDKVAERIDYLLANRETCRRLIAQGHELSEVEISRLLDLCHERLNAGHTDTVDGTRQIETLKDRFDALYQRKSKEIVSTARKAAARRKGSKQKEGAGFNGMQLLVTITKTVELKNSMLIYLTHVRKIVERIRAAVRDAE